VTTLIVLLVVLALTTLTSGVLTVLARLSATRKAVDAAWAEVEVRLGERHQLIPDLVGTVERLAGEEREILGAMAADRQAALAAIGPAEIAAAETRLSGSLRHLAALGESSLPLRENRPFGRLRTELAGAEERLDAAVERYNDLVGWYNKAVRTVPRNVLDGLTGFRVRVPFAEPGDERGPVEVGS
jgi:LemA protein